MSGNHIPFQTNCQTCMMMKSDRVTSGNCSCAISMNCEACALEYRRLGETLRLCGRLAGPALAPETCPQRQC